MENIDNKIKYAAEDAANRVRHELASKIIESFGGRVYYNPRSLRLCVDLKDRDTVDFNNNTELLDYAFDLLLTKIHEKK